MRLGVDADEELVGPAESILGNLFWNAPRHHWQALVEAVRVPGRPVRGCAAPGLVRAVAISDDGSIHVSMHSCARFLSARVNKLMSIHIVHTHVSSHAVAHGYAGRAARADLYLVYIGIADGMSIARVWAPTRSFGVPARPYPRNRHAEGDAEIEPI